MDMKLSHQERKGTVLNVLLCRETTLLVTVVVVVPSGFVWGSGDFMQLGSLGHFPV